MPRPVSPFTHAKRERTNHAWALLIAAPDPSAYGLLAAIAREAGLSAPTLTRMKDRLTRLRAEYTKPTGKWEVDGFSRFTATERASRVAEAVARQEAAIAERHRARSEARAAQKCPAQLPRGERPEKRIIVPRV